MKITFTPSGGSETIIADGVNEPSIIVAAAGRQVTESVLYVRATSSAIFPRAGAQETISFDVSKQYSTSTLAAQACLYYPASISRAKGSLKIINPADSKGVQLNNCCLVDWKLKEKMGVENVYEFTFIGESYTQLT
jgi:hypothetical protein